jgi:hypothetical protein
LKLQFLDDADEVFFDHEKVVGANEATRRGRVNRRR